MDKIFAPLRKALESENGYALAEVFSPLPPPQDPGRSYAITRAASPFTVQQELRSFLKYLRIDPDSRDIWLDILLNYWKSLTAILTAEETDTALANGSSTVPADWTKVYNTWKDLLNSLHRGYSQSHLEPWTLPLLYLVTRHLRLFAIRADRSPSPNTTSSTTGPNSGSLDDIASSTGGSPSQANLEDAARQINRIFALVSQDRSPPPNRKYGTYYVAVLLFKTYFRLQSIALCKNIVRSIGAIAATDMPPLAAFPKSHQVQYRYFVGVVDFLEERYAAAEEHLCAAWDMCLGGDGGRGQAERVLMYLVPTRLITKHQLPTVALLGRYPRAERLFGTLCKATRRGDLRGFDEALAAGEESFVRMRIYLTLERGRDVCLRNLLRKIYLAAGFEEGKEGVEGARRSRLTVAEFRAGLRVVGEDLEGDEVEGLIAGMIYKNLMKGYISRAHSMVVLNKKGAFPGTGV